MVLNETFGVIHGLMGLINFVVHSSILMSILWNRKIRREKCNQLLIPLNTGHAISSLVTFVNLWRGDIYRIATVWFIEANLALIVYSLDRCLKIRFPFFHQRLPEKMHIVALVISPMVGFALTVEFFLTWYKVKVVTANEMTLIAYGTIIFMVFLMVSNGLVYMTVVQQRKKININSITTSTDSVDTPSIQQQQPRQQQPQQRQQQPQPQQRQPQPQTQQQKRRKSDFRPFYICIVCVITYTIFWLPMVVYILVWRYTTSATQVPASPNIIKIGYSSNVFCDALVILMFNKKIRKNLKGVLDKIF